MIDISAFSFDSEGLNLNPKTDFIAKIRRGLPDRSALFEVLRRELHFPHYFGDNWDALSECLRDLSWIQHRRVVTLHEDLPLSGTKEAAVYLEILSQCARDWKTKEDHEFMAIFPLEVRDAID
jgi:hypothetical protein